MVDRPTATAAGTRWSHQESWRRPALVLAAVTVVCVLHLGLSLRDEVLRTPSRPWNLALLGICLGISLASFLSIVLGAVRIMRENRANLRRVADAKARTAQMLEDVDRRTAEGREARG